MRDKLLQNKLDRETAQEIFELIGSESRSIRFWESLQELIKAVLPAPPEPKVFGVIAMTNDKAIQFERERMPRGVHLSEEIGTVPCEYLCWWAEGGDEFTIQLRRYVRSERFKQRQIEEVQDD